MGTFVSSLVLLPIGIFLTWKSTRDSNLFNPDKYLAILKKFTDLRKRDRGTI